RGDQQPFGLSPDDFLAWSGAATPEEMVDALLRVLVDGDVSASVRSSLLDYALNGYDGDPASFFDDAARLDRAVRGVAHLIMTTPVYQLA
ncbi:MAG: hypothetical protein JO247_15440, partial [Chloroflexi bacterium]|nr:hypothetical protein [Chloroflexota bacterium]